ncbi:type II restriction endonuclease BsuBI [Dulcicalothrix desertica PCC 7102]|uniref:Type II restriction endonuclease BsuBI n=1 Tax=Dulcicalothrix desertica PCC 7102 TaxID=232991 RepID=A0A3S1CND1_9CYAN|nr:BsuBI/PstI family type II restriction endonuclease [Dulcicalothrix desertica]RUS95524.1 type II restriction endonuclease BsuBI [Dulcicalothrix desertica PCC 7102]TWH54085.1 type II restriction enzyme [Dulcicalothrix desertica PCC 7102]
MSEVPEYIYKSDKPIQLKSLINEALYILDKFGIPLSGLSQRRMERMAMAFLAVANVKQNTDWAKADYSHALRTRDIIRYCNNHFHENISESSYDDIRRKDLKLIVLAKIINASSANPNAARNDGTRKFALNPEYTALIKKFESDKWEQEVEEFLSSRETLEEQLSDKRDLNLIPVIFSSGKTFDFSPGKHNELQKLIIEEFLPRYGYGAEILYVGDTANKFLHLEAEILKRLKFFEISHGELPDIIAYSLERNWLYLIEAVHTSGAISPVRLLELKKLTEQCEANIIFVTAFLDRTTFRQFSPDIAWETEVWIADAPDHIIHFNGDKFMGPYLEK